MNFVILLYVLYQIRMYMSLKMQPNEKRWSLSDLASCRICYEMFSFEFDYDKFQASSDTEKSIASMMNWLKNDPQVNSSELINVQALAQEIAMKYFLKSGEIQFNEANKITCDKTPIGDNADCDKLKLGTCTLIISSNVNCPDLLQKLYRNEFKRLESGNNQLKASLNSYNTLGQPISLNSNISSSSNLISTNPANSNVENKLLSLSQILNLETDQLVNGPAQFTKQPNQQYQTDNSSIQKHNKHNQDMPISLIEIAPEVKEYDITKLQTDPKNASSQNNGNSSWSPPRPALFDNFQDNLGNQLKEISFLTK